MRRLLTVLGAAGFLGAPMIGIALVLAHLGYVSMTGRVDGLLSAVYMLGFLCSAVGLRVLRVTGRSVGGAVISWIQVTGAVLAIVWAVLTAAGVANVPGV